MTSGIGEALALIKAALEDLLKEQNPDLADQIDQLLADDPSGTKKYLRWQLRQLKRGEPVDEVVRLTKAFHKYLQKIANKDITSYAKLGDLKSVIEALTPSRSESEKRGNYEYLMDTDDLLVVYVKDMEASCHYGRGAKWCISTEIAENLFDEKSGDNEYFYFVIDKKAKEQAKWSKVAVEIAQGEKVPTTYWNSHNDNVTKQTVDKSFRLPSRVWLPVVLKRHAKQHDTMQYRLKSGTPSNEDIDSIMKSNNVKLKQQLARNTSSPPELLTKLAGDSDDVVRESVARNTSSPPELLTKLADGPLDIRLYVARNTSSPPEALTNLAGDSEKYVRWAVASNVRSPPETLVKLASNPDDITRGHVADNTASPPKLLLKLASDPDYGVRFYVAQNTSSPPEALVKLASDPHHDTRIYIASSKRSPSKALVKLASDTDDRVRWYVAKNTSSPPEALAKLANDPDETVRGVAVKNPNYNPTVQAMTTDVLEQTVKVGSQLNTKLWDAEDRLRPDVKELLLKLSKDFAEGFDYPLSIKDIIVTGSSANYNWNKFSDIDLHLVVDYESVPDDLLPAFLDYADAKRRIWNKEHDIMIHGHEVEMYVQPEDSELKAAGIYSIMKDKWLAKPDKTKRTEPDRDTIAKKAGRIRYLASVVFDLVNSDPEAAYAAATALKEKIRKLRAAGLSTGGEQSSENLAFKVLRNDGTLAMLDDVHRRAYDLAHTVG